MWRPLTQDRLAAGGFRRSRPSSSASLASPTPRVRIERTTCRLEGGCSIQLSYRDRLGSLSARGWGAVLARALTRVRSRV